MAKSSQKIARRRDDAVISRLVFFWLMLSAFPALAQEQGLPFTPLDEIGAPFMNYYGPKDYGTPVQNWCAVQDHRGVMYFGNSIGIFEFDGVSWRVIPSLLPVRAMAIDSLERIYAGGADDFGYLTPDAQRQWRFVSLRNYVRPEDRDFGIVHKIYATATGIYFQAERRVFHWRNDHGALQAWRPQTRFLRAFVIGNRFYVGQSQIGLMQMQGDSLRLAPQGQRFAPESIMTMLPYPVGTRTPSSVTGPTAEKILIGTRENGLFLYDGATCQPFVTAADAYLRANEIAHGGVLSNGTLVLGTSKGGAVFLDPAGRGLQVLNETTGLRDNAVYSVFTDRQDALWLTLSRGIVRVETPSPLSVFGNPTEYNGDGGRVFRHRAALYLSKTAKGLFVLRRQPPSNVNPAQARWEFRRALGKPAGEVSVLLAVNPWLFATGAKGIYRIDGEQVTLIHKSADATATPSRLYRSRQDTNRFYVGQREGVACFRLHDGEWRDAIKIPGIHEYIYSLIEDDNGALWVTPFSGGMIRVNFPGATPTSLLQPQITRFDSTHGLPMGSLDIYRTRTHLVFMGTGGLYRFDETRQRFLPDSTFGAQFADGSYDVVAMAETPVAGDSIWVTTERPYGIHLVVRQPDGNCRLQDTPLRRVPKTIFPHIYPEANGVVWFGSYDFLVRYDPAIPRHEVSDYAALSFENTTENRFQYFLEGFEENWSDWIKETFKDYTNLPEGQYRFRVRARNVYGQQSREAIYALEILPPWYRVWWAYWLYAFFAAAALVAVIKGRVRYLEKRTRELETTVAARTAEVVAQKQHIEKQKEQLETQAEKLRELDRMKSHFFANISHEFRTPLTLILGPAEQIEEKAASAETKEKIGVIKRNAQRLLRLINQLLDLSRLESGKMRLRAAPGDVVPFLKGLVMSFASLAERKRITLQFLAQEKTLELYFDQDKLEKIFANLLSNAFKFTPEGGGVEVAVAVGSSSDSSQLSATAPATATVTVSDTGIGIPSDHLPYVFDRFYQATAGSAGGVFSSHTREHAAPLDRNDPTWRASFDESYPTGQGTGIGLALAKELVELHRGAISVASAEGQGTTFTVRLPLGKDHLSPEEIIATAVMAMPVHDGGELLDEDTPVSSDQYSVVSDQNANDLRPTIQPSIDPRIQDQELILIVEDHADLRRYIREHLQAEYRVLEAANGVEGLERAFEAIPDLVISDVMMPKMNGYEMCARLKTDARTSHIPVILLTAKAGAEDKIEGLETGADDYLNKPFEARELLARAKNLIAQRRKLRERFSPAKGGVIKPTEVSATSIDQAFLQRVAGAIEVHFGEEEFSVEALAEEVHMSASQLNRKLKALIDQPAGELLRSMRLQRAADLLAQNAGSIAEIAYQVGFSDQAHFTRSFKKQFGVSPKDYRRKAER